jgi:hypothetical protein
VELRIDAERDFAIVGAIARFATRGAKRRGEVDGDASCWKTA